MNIESPKSKAPIYTLSTEGRDPRSEYPFLKPRAILAVGFAIEPLPKGECKYPGVIGSLKWRKSSLLGWKLPGYVKIDGDTYSLAAYGAEPVLRAVEGKLDHIKKKRKVRIEGIFNGSMQITISNKFIKPGKKMKANALKFVPVMNVSRIVILNPKFLKNYAYMFGNSLSPKKRKKSDEGEIIKVGPLGGR